MPVISLKPLVPWNGTWSSITHGESKKFLLEMNVKGAQGDDYLLQVSTEQHPRSLLNICNVELISVGRNLPCAPSIGNGTEYKKR